MSMQPRTKCSMWGMALLLSASFTAQAEVTPSPGTGDRRVRSATYDADQIYRLTAHVGYQIELEFEPGEVLLGQGAGDLEGIVIASYENHVFLKPKAADVSTNLTLATNRRRYRFEYIVEARRPTRGAENVMYVVRFTYPRAPGEGPSAAERVESSLATRRDRNRNLDYWYCGHRSVRPVAVSDDGVHTRFTFDARQELPALFVRNDDGSDALLNFSVEEGDIIVHRVAARFILKRGRLSGCVVNRGFDGAGTRLDSGTVSPDVQRERRELP